VPKAAAALAGRYPGIELRLVDVHPVLRQGEIDVALIFRYADTPVEEEGFRLVHVADDPVHLVSQRPASIANYSESAWIGCGCQRCQADLISMCQRSGFTPRVAFVSDDMVVMQALVAAGMGVTILPGLALQAHRSPGVHTTELPRPSPTHLRRHVRQPTRPARDHRAHPDHPSIRLRIGLERKCAAGQCRHRAPTANSQSFCTDCPEQ
jgi:DNA-binding transcriptional LysR family regulator